MKKLKYLFAAIAFIGISHSYAQVPDWGVPVTNQRYYYLPDIETYYDIPSHQYVYIREGKWVRARTLPAAYRSYNLHTGRKIVLNDYRGAAPYTYYNVHRVKYARAAYPTRVYVDDKDHKHEYHNHGHHKGKGHYKGRGKGHQKHGD